MLSLNAKVFLKDEGDNYIYHFIFYIFIAALIVFGVVYPIFSVIALVSLALYVLLALPCNVFYALFFLMPFASIFKTSPSSSSFFTYIMLLAVLKLLIYDKKINSRFLVCYLIFFCYIMIGANGNYAMLMKQAALLPLIYFFFSDSNINQINFKHFVLSYANGVLISGVVAMISDYIPNISKYVQNDIAYEIGLSAVRFTGLYSDPNYYSMALILAMSCVFIMYSHGIMRGGAFVYYAAVMYFGIQTLSRSFLILFAILSVMFVFDLFANKKYKTAFAFLILLIAAVILIINSKITIFDGIIDRFIYANDGDVTGNRTKIYSVYIEYLSENTWKLLFGSGVGASFIGVAAHNTYIDFLYYYGIFGSVMFFVVLVSVICNAPKIKKNTSNLLPVICFAISIFFLSDLIYFDFAFNLIICLFIFTTDMRKKKEMLEV